MEEASLDIELENDIFDTPERILVFGTSGSGKTTLVENLVKRYIHRFWHIKICGSKNRLLEFPETKAKTSYFSSDSDNVIFDPFLEVGHYEVKKNVGKQYLYIIDDMMETVYKDRVVSKVFSQGRHWQISCLILLQTYCPTGSGTNLFPQIKENSSIQIFTKTRSLEQIGLVARRNEYNKSSREFFVNLFKKVVLEQKYGYLAIFLDSSDQRARYRTNLIQEDDTPYHTVFMHQK